MNHKTIATYSIFEECIGDDALIDAAHEIVGPKPYLLSNPEIDTKVEVMSAST
jgi:hypothetical protein